MSSGLTPSADSLYDMIVSTNSRSGVSNVITIVEITAPATQFISGNGYTN